LLWGLEKRFGWVLLIPVSVFSVMPLGKVMVLYYYLDNVNLSLLSIYVQHNLKGVQAGFWMACFAIVFLALSFHERCFREKPIPDTATCTSVCTRLSNLSTD
jgi:hypothetical protein